MDWLVGFRCWCLVSWLVLCVGGCWVMFVGGFSFLVVIVWW